MSAVMGEDADASLSDPHKATLVKQAALWFRIHGILDRMLAALKHLAGLITRMETRRGPEDYEIPDRGVYVRYDGNTGPPPGGESTWQTWLLAIVGTVVGLGIPSIGGILWSMNTKLEQQAGQNSLINQRLEQQERHMESTDRHVETLEREIWPHKH